MSGFKLKEHSVQAASFIRNKEKDKEKKVEVRVEGSISIPKDYDNSRYVAVQLKFHLGNPDERLYLALETLSAYEVEMERCDIDISEEAVQASCLPIALAELRKTVKRVTEAYGMPALELPPFEEE